MTMRFERRPERSNPALHGSRGWASATSLATREKSIPTAKSSSACSRSRVTAPSSFGTACYTVPIRIDSAFWRASNSALSSPPAVSFIVFPDTFTAAPTEAFVLGLLRQPRNMHHHVGYAWISLFGRLLNAEYTKHIFLRPTTTVDTPEM